LLFSCSGSSCFSMSLSAISVAVLNHLPSDQELRLPQKRGPGFS
jgi:hypothetical protein